MAHVFISYSKHNKAYARRLADHLIASGFDVWIDDRIDYGSLWADVIQQAIDNCAALVVIMTPESRDSQWVQTECEYAAQKGKQAFPLLLDGEVFFRYVSVQYVSVMDGSLPPDAFLDEVAEHAPRKHGRGEDVTAPEASEEKQPSPIPRANILRRARSRRRAPLVMGTGLMAAVLLVALVLLWPEHPSAAPDATPSQAEPTHVATPAEGIAAAPTRLRQAGECQYDWFFGNEYAVSGDCPISAVTEVSGLTQEFGGGVLLGVMINTYGDGRYFVLDSKGPYQDLSGNWDTSSVSIGACVLPSVVGFKEHVSYEGTADEVIGCPVQPVQLGTLNYQTSDARAEFVVYIGTPAGAVYRLAAPSSRPETQGTWQRIK
jgi:hypothetical protein